MVPIVQIIFTILKESDQEAGIPLATLMDKIRSTPECANHEALPETVRRELDKAAAEGLLEVRDETVKLLPTSCPAIPNSAPDSATTAPEPDAVAEPAVDGVVTTRPAEPASAIRRASTRVRTVPPRFAVQEDSVVVGRRPGRQRRTVTGGRVNRHPVSESRSRSRSERRGRSVSRGRAGSGRN